MGRKGESGHLKRKPAPKIWPIHRKEFVWTVMPKPGPHSLSRSLPLILIVRDMLKFAKTAKEAKTIISQGKILVDGKVRRDEKYLVGLMDIISIIDTKKSYRILPSTKGLFLHPVGSEESKFKLYRIEDKTIVKEGNITLDLHDGSNFFVKQDNTSSTEKDDFHTLDVLKLTIDDREIIEHDKLSTGTSAIVIGGKNMGMYGKISKIEKRSDKKRRDLLVTLKDGKGLKFQTILDFVFILGKDRPLISLPEVN